MEQKLNKPFIRIGITSIIFIFIVMCLSVFALLSVNSASQSYASVRRAADAASAYYAADSQAQIWIHQVKSEGEAGGNVLRRDFPISDSQTLQVALDGSTFRILSYQVVNNEVLEIDDSLPVWQGEEELQ
ncbi:MAG TPA: hypothetical protein IAA04_11235 [Candidatus Lachnoclostridium pullistercoris]|uniref:DUF4860 domain-containing protein n=1 Tax=Candidatus Lachnoclostridium pullistercoris TaxID=2838632 RepID=A0A9D2T853_9FIRM|nr:hypothetical protein [Candidatus Lachnoclostridium pullistercoris]